MRHLFRRWRALWAPEMYHGWGKKRSYFEGWYFKLVAPAQRAALAVIPGISFHREGRAEAFIQVLDGQACTTAYHRFDARAFRPSSRTFSLRLAGNYFSLDRLELDLPDLQGSLQLQHPYRWPWRLSSPGIMGWYTFVPFMQCYHGVLSMDHGLAGSLHYRNEAIDFSGGRGYLEKDWGRSFPSAWIWMQTNHFSRGPGNSLMVSVARIPWLGNHFIGFITALLVDGHLYRFASYTGAERRVWLQGDTVCLSFRDRGRRLDIKAHKRASGELISPIEGAMTGKLNESLQAQIEVELWEEGRCIFQDEGHHAGLELAGPVDILLCDHWRRD